MGPLVTTPLSSHLQPLKPIISFPFPKVPAIYGLSTLSFAVSFSGSFLVSLYLDPSLPFFHSSPLLTGPCDAPDASGADQGDSLSVRATVSIRLRMGL